MDAAADTFGMPLLTDELTVDEGCPRYPYTDTRGCLSIGIGRNLTGNGLSVAEVNFLFANDVAACCADLDAHAPWWRSLTAIRQRVMINLCFNMGWSRLSLFTHFLAAMQARDWASAAYELRDSKWFEQVGTRGPRVIARLLGTEAVA